MSLTDYPDLTLGNLSDDERRRATAFLRRNNATDLADLLGLTKEN